jgi:hypothetical protein
MDRRTLAPLAFVGLRMTNEVGIECWRLLSCASAIAFAIFPGNTLAVGSRIVASDKSFTNIIGMSFTITENAFSHTVAFLVAGTFSNVVLVDIPGGLSEVCSFWRLVSESCQSVVS